jgi:CRISPR-associated endonuclease/helicase Cas3
MSRSPFSLLTLWAKSRGGDQNPPFHPLLFHLLDVAAVTEAIWDRVLAPAAEREIAAGLGLGTDVAAARRWVIFLAGAHDIGKASPAFQYMKNSAPDEAQKALHEQFIAANLLKTEKPNQTRHGPISTLILQDVLTQEGYGWVERDAENIATAIGGHHGIFPSSALLGDEATHYARGQKGAWPAAQCEMLATLATLLGGLPEHAPQGVTTAAAMTVAGLVSVADWIGSDESRFQYATCGKDGLPTLSPEAYWGHAQECAAIAISQLHWQLPAEPVGHPRDFREIVGGKFDPNPTQQAAINRAAATHAPGLTIIESPMGEGKTEAALYLMEHAARVLGATGCYIALPTQATSNQMFARVVAYLRTRFPASADAVNVQLLHGHADLSALFALLRQAAETGIPPGNASPITDAERDAEAPNASVVAAEWFTYRKRGLLAPFGVGTVDQGLLAVLQTRHVFVRLFGLAHKCIIIDEVHAYDTYMTTLLGRLLMWLGALGCPVVLLSATLPNDRREDLLRAYAEGTGYMLDASAPLPTAPYPRLSWIENGVADAVAITGVSPRSTKRVRVAWLDGTVPEADGAEFPLGKLLAKKLENGGCAAVICNTVARAQTVYRALQRYFPESELALDGHPVLDLLHSRYRFIERQQREQRTLLRFGKPGDTVDVAQGGVTTPQAVNRPRRAVLVATQIIEQSLDLDFDLMVTDFAPADLVLQRLGRLHRHDRPHRPTGDDCTLYLCRPVSVSPDGVPTFEQYFDLIYDEHVLLRSWLTLHDRTGLFIPGDVEGIIENVYGVQECPTIYPDALRAEWQKTRDEKEQDDAGEANEARDRHLKRPDFGGELWEIVPALGMEEDAPDLHKRFQALTRLSDESVSVVLLYPHECDALLGGKPPSLKGVREILRRSLTVSTRRAVAIIREEGEKPTAWQKSKFLRHHYCVRLDANGKYGRGKRRLHYDKIEGLTVIEGSEVMP